MICQYIYDFYPLYDLYLSMYVRLYHLLKVSLSKPGQNEESDRILFAHHDFYGEQHTPDGGKYKRQLMQCVFTHIASDKKNPQPSNVCDFVFKSSLTAKPLSVLLLDSNGLSFLPRYVVSVYYKKKKLK